MNKKSELVSILIASIILLMLVPLNLQMTETPYGIYILYSYIFYIVFWLIPAIYIYKKDDWIKKYIILIIINIILIPIFLYFAEKESNYNRKVIKQRVYELQKQSK